MNKNSADYCLEIRAGELQSNIKRNFFPSSAENLTYIVNMLIQYLLMFLVFANNDGQLKGDEHLFVEIFYQATDKHDTILDTNVTFPFDSRTFGLRKEVIVHRAKNSILNFILSQNSDATQNGDVSQNGN